MKVYVVTLDLRHEPGDVLGVFSTRAKAEAFAVNQRAYYFGLAIGVTEHELDSK